MKASARKTCSYGSASRAHSSVLQQQPPAMCAPLLRHAGSACDAPGVRTRRARVATQALGRADDIVDQAAAGLAASAHDSIVSSSVASLQSFLDTAPTADGPEALKAVINAALKAQGAPGAVQRSLAAFGDRLSQLSLSPPSAVSAALLDLRSAADGALQALSGLMPAGPGPSGFSEWLPAGAGAAAFAAPDLSGLQAYLEGLAGRHSEQELVAAAVAAAVVAVVASVTASVSAASQSGVASDSELPTEYDRDAIYSYWSSRPVTLLQRTVETAVAATAFALALQFDNLTGQSKENEAARAAGLRVTVDRLGPAYIKVAQALSTRVDLLTPVYFQEITKLQDQVLPFPDEDAMAIIEAELGRPPEEVFSSISPKPVAAASLGQVYRATLRSNGAEVAIKVQRPGVLELVALDLVLGRRIVQTLGTLFPSMSSQVRDFLPVLDEWAFKFYREMDYRKEAAVMKQFAADLRRLEGILVPAAFDEVTTRRVLVTQWIEGEKLSESKEEDVRELCTTLLNAYLIQLLDTGLLHADPHPGNLIRTPDGRICILDYGLVTEVPPKFRIYILEYMAHLSLKDWAAVGDDFVKLQFIAEDSQHPNSIPGLMDSVGAVLEILMQGGGAANMDALQNRELVDLVGLDPDELGEAGFMDGFASVLDTLANPGSADEGTDSKDRERARKIAALNRSVKFRLPPYFVLILRAFSVIEGIALKVDPKYSIIQETFPYLARRLLTDDNAEIRRALRQVLYGTGNRMDLSRFQSLFESLQRFSTDGLQDAAPSDGQSSRAARAPGAGPPQPAPSTDSDGVLDKNTLLALKSVLSTQGTSYIQELLVAELAATLESLSRGAAVALLQRALTSSVTKSTMQALESLGPLRRVLLPFPLPAEIISQFGSIITLTEDDEVAISNVQRVWELLSPQLTPQLGRSEMQLSLVRSFASTVQQLPGDTRMELVTGAGRTSQMVLEQVVRRTAARLAQDLAAMRGESDLVADVLGRGGALGGGTVSDRRPV